jgi:beta-fructofuranosidase
MLQIHDHFVWDSWYAHDGDRWHAFYLQAPKSIGDPELRHWNVSVGHSVSDDLINWEHLGTCFRPSQGPAWDDYTTWTGSVVRDEAGLWHLFYTGASHSEDALYQRIGHATSRNLHDWERVGDGLCLDLAGLGAEAYEADFETSVWHDRAMRDPWVMRDPEGDGWLMFFTCRASGVAEPNAGGAIGCATSPDLQHWTLEPPVFVGGYGQLEVPQVFEHRGRWFCLFCTAAEHFSAEQAQALEGGPVTGNHYLEGDGPRGPWRIAKGFLDGALPCRRYAARVVNTGDGLVLLGFADRPEGDFLGHIMDPEPITMDDHGRLHVGPLATTE